MRHVEVLVVGAGPAGMAAASAAAAHGRQVVVLDANMLPGGQNWRESTVPEGRDPKPSSPRQRALERLRRSGAQVLSSRRVFAAHRSGTLQALHETSSGCVVEEFHFEQLTLATGAREGFLPFPGWTLPGVFGAAVCKRSCAAATLFVASV